MCSQLLVGVCRRGCAYRHIPGSTGKLSRMSREVLQNEWVRAQRCVPLTLAGYVKAELPSWSFSFFSSQALMLLQRPRALMLLQRLRVTRRAKAIVVVWCE